MINPMKKTRDQELLSYTEQQVSIHCGCKYYRGSARQHLQITLHTLHEISLQRFVPMNMTPIQQEASDSLIIS